ncbi:hypothetical protein TNCV_3973491 [Trichonephila clavipes]|nr:hypothetical protein TNCV_3973491 [Trichonephila clavipes]
MTVVHVHALALGMIVHDGVTTVHHHNAVKRSPNSCSQKLVADRAGLSDCFGLLFLREYLTTGTTAQGEPWPFQEAFSRPAFFLPVFSNSLEKTGRFSKLGDHFLGYQYI